MHSYICAHRPRLQSHTMLWLTCAVFGVRGLCASCEAPHILCLRGMSPTMLRRALTEEEAAGCLVDVHRLTSTHLAKVAYGGTAAADTLFFRLSNSHSMWVRKCQTWPILCLQVIESASTTTSDSMQCICAQDCCCCCRCVLCNASTVLAGVLAITLTLRAIPLLLQHTQC